MRGNVAEVSARLLTGALGLGAVALGSCGASYGAGSSPSHPASSRSAACHPSGSHTIVANRLARAFTLSGVVYACAERSGKRYRLGRVTFCIGSDRAGPVALSGELVAYGLERCGVDTGFSQVVVRSLSTGRQTRAEAATSTPLGPESYASVDAIVVKGDGSIGWIADASSIVGHRRIREVRRSDATGTTLLDSSPAIVAGSLRLHGSRLTWRRGRSMRSATLR